MVVDLLRPERRDFVLQTLRYLVVGVANTLVTFAAIWAMRAGLGAPVWLASVVGYAVGMLQGFLLNRGWTFAATASDGPVAAQALKFIAVNAVGGGFFTGVNVVLNHWLPLQVSSVLAAGSTMPLTFLLNRWFVFGSKAA